VTRTNSQLTRTVQQTADMLGVGIEDVRRKLKHNVLERVGTEDGKRCRVTLYSIVRYLGVPEAEAARMIVELAHQAGSNGEASLKATNAQAPAEHLQHGLRSGSGVSRQQPEASGTRSSTVGRRSLRRAETNPAIDSGDVSPATRVALALLERPVREGEL